MRLPTNIRLTGLIALFGGLSMGLGGEEAAEAEAADTHMSEARSEQLGLAQPARGEGRAPMAEVAATRVVFAPGLDGAAAALASGDALAARTALAAAPGFPTEGSATWFRRGAVAGRVHRLTGGHGEAVEALAPIVAHPDLSSHLPREIMAYELARARIAYARSGKLGREAADEQLRAAADEIAAHLGARPNRIGAPMRVARAIALAEVQGEDEKAAFWAAKRAMKDLDRVIANYPNHPELGDLLMLRVRTMIRNRRHDAAAAELRRIAIERAGEPEADAAWDLLGELAAERRGIKRAPFTPSENLRRAQWARSLRRVETSRWILDEMVGDPDLPRSFRVSARRSRAFTAYKQRDYVTCAQDWRAEYERSHSYPVRDDLVRCLERAHQYDEAIAVWLDVAKRKHGPSRAAAIFEALMLAVRGGLYADAEDYLARYEKLSRGHAGTRRWLHAWLPYRLGREAEAIEGFADVERRRGDDAKRASYFRGKLLLRSRDREQEAQGEEILRGMMEDDPLDYYGLQARQRLLEVGADPGPLPELAAMPDESDTASHAEVAAQLRQVAKRHGHGFSGLNRVSALYDAGYLEEARRAFRAVTDTYLTGTIGTGYQPRNEDIIVGLGWKEAWKLPRMRPDRDERRLLRDDDAADQLRADLRRLAALLHEPHRLSRLTPSAQYPSYAVRWHPRAFRPVIERHAASHDLSPTHLWALMFTESRFRRHVVSPVGARGALQIMPWTGRQLAARLGELEGGHFDVDSLFDIETNARLSSYYVSELLKKFHGQAPLVYAAYNGGPYNVERWVVAKASQGLPLELDAFVEEIPFSETYRYIRRVMMVEAAYRLLYGGSLPVWDNSVDPVVESNIDF